ncbi:3-hydroxyacyl-CoA dehydrogenase [Peribacillus sp. SCS-26]|uniref:3-hydroxyacyl-CoA dehydrogenase n=1 Tax=Paraperibacillus marinus TaxID=3115295 RepID=UPI003905766D
MKVEDCKAIVSGGASGLGEAVIRLIAAKGGSAAILDRDAAKGEALAKELGRSVVYCHCDIRDEGQVKHALESALEHFKRIDALINCAGIVIGRKVMGRSGLHDLESFERVIGVNLIGTFNLVRLAAEKMTANVRNGDGERGVIINTASIAGFEGQIGQAAYSASKAGVAGLTLPLAREFAIHGIRVMTIAPGLFDTPMFASLPEEARGELGSSVPFPSRLGKPAEYAGLVKAILENPMLNGEIIRLDGAVRLMP